MVVILSSFMLRPSHDFLIRPIKAGVVAQAGFRANAHRGRPIDQQLRGIVQALARDILHHGAIRSLSEQIVQLGFGDEKTIGQLVQR